MGIDIELPKVSPQPYTRLAFELTGLQSKDALVAAIEDAQRAGSDVQG
jgi:hypothetical protein